jgi:hypothetical protein
MNQVTYIIFTLLIAFAGYTQQGEEELLSTLASKKGEGKIQTYYSLSLTTLQWNPEKAIDYADKGIALSNKIGSQLWKTKGILMKARIDVSLGRYDASIDKFLQVMYSQQAISKSDSVELLGGLGTSMGALGAYNMAIDFRKELLELRKLKTGPDVYYPLDNIAYSYLMLKEYDSANYYYDLACDEAEKMGDATTLMHSYNNVGYGYFVQRNVNKSLELYSRGISTFNGNINPKVRDSILYAMLERNMALAHSDLHEYSLAELAMLRSTDIFDKTSTLEFSPRNKVLTAGIQLKLTKYSEAKLNLDDANSTIVSTKDRLHYYEILSDYYLAVNNSGSAAETLNKYIRLQAEEADNKNTYSKINDIIDFQTNRIKSELRLQGQLRENESEISQLKIQLIVGGSVMLIIIMTLLFLRSQTNRKKKEQLLEADNLLNRERLKIKEVQRENLETELKNKNKDLTDFAIDITRKHEFIEEILEKLRELRSADDVDSIQLRSTIQFVKEQLLIDDSLKLFQDNIDQVNHEFMTKLETMFPELTKSEKQLCALLRLKLTSKEIAMIKNVSADSVKTLRHRLRKKLSLASNKDIGEFLSDFG